MKEEKFYGLDASDIEMLIRARDYLKSVKDTLLNKLETMEQLSYEEYEPHNHEHYGMNEAYVNLGTALEYIEQSFDDLQLD